MPREEENPPSPPPAESHKKQGPPRKGVWIYLNDDGSMDTAAMREGTREKLRQAVASTPMFSAPGNGPQVEVQIFNPMMIEGMYNLLGSLECVAFQKAFPVIPPTLIRQVIPYTPQEKAALVPPTVRVLNKHANAWMIKWQDELALGTLLLSMTVNKVQALLMLAKEFRSGPIPFVAPSQAESEENEKKESDGPEPQAPN